MLKHIIVLYDICFVPPFRQEWVKDTRLSLYIKLNIQLENMVQFPVHLEIHRLWIGISKHSSSFTYSRNNKWINVNNRDLVTVVSFSATYCLSILRKLVDRCVIIGENQNIILSSMYDRSLSLLIFRKSLSLTKVSDHVVIWKNITIKNFLICNIC